MLDEGLGEAEEAEREAAAALEREQRETPHNDVPIGLRNNDYATPLLSTMRRGLVPDDGIPSSAFEAGAGPCSRATT